MRLRIAAACLVVLAWTGPADAAVIIDDFAATSLTWPLPEDSPTQVIDTVVGPGAIATQRTFHRFASVPGRRITLFANASASVLDFALDSATTLASRTILSWSNEDESFLALDGNGVIEFVISGFDAPATDEADSVPLLLLVNVGFENDQGRRRNASFDLGFTDPGPQVPAIDLRPELTDADLGRVLSIGVFLQTPAPGVDLRLDQVRAIPEPGVGLIALMGVLVAASRRQRA